MEQPLNTVDYLLKNKVLTHQLRVEIKRLGRPMPELNIHTVEEGRTRNYSRKFNKEIYKKFDWMCGCEIRNKLFCFVCLVMGREKSAWTQEGVSDLKHLNERAKKHSNNNEKHVHSILDFSALGKIDIRQQLDSAYRENIRKHNENVDKNRHILNQLINCILFCGAFDLALRGHDETEGSENPGIFRGLVNFVAELDVSMKEHL
jgi:hypothetical protein